MLCYKTFFQDGFSTVNQFFSERKTVVFSTFRAFTIVCFDTYTSKYFSGLKEVDARLQAEAAGGATLLKSIVIRLEDARILENIDDMRKRLMQLKNINGDLIREHEIRLNSHRELAASLKELNIGVQRAARLRGNVFIV